MRLVISGGSFALEDIPSAIDLSDLRIFRRVSWSARARRLTWSLPDAGAIREALERRGVRLADDEVRAAVARTLEHDPVEGPAWIAAFCDERAIPELSHALDAFAPRCDCAVCDHLAVLGLGTAIHALGGVPTESQRLKIAAYERRQRGVWVDGATLERFALAEVAPLAAAEKLRARLGRNDPCPCGSGRKYKHCHLDLDRAVPAETRH